MCTKGLVHHAKCSLNCLCVKCLHKMKAVLCCCGPCMLNSSQAPLEVQTPALDVTPPVGKVGEALGEKPRPLLPAYSTPT